MNKKLVLSFVYLLLQINVWGQIKITGKVVGKSNKYALPGVTIIEKGTQNGTITSIDGDFVLFVNDSNAVLRFNYIGYKSQEIRLNGQTEMTIKLKMVCFKDWFDTQEFGLYANSGLINTPIGGQIELTFPAYFNQATIRSRISYQTELNNNNFLNTQLGLYHILVDCHYDIDVSWFYRELKYDNKINLKAHYLETNLNFDDLIFNIPFRLVLGYSHIEFAEATANNEISTFSPIIGLGTWIGSYVFITSKVSLHKKNEEYQGEITGRFKKFRTFARFYKMGSFSEISVGIGAYTAYRLKKNKTKM